MDDDWWLKKHQEWNFQPFDQWWQHCTLNGVTPIFIVCQLWSTHQLTAMTLTTWKLQVPKCHIAPVFSSYSGLNLASSYLRVKPNPYSGTATATKNANRCHWICPILKGTHRRLRSICSHLHILRQFLEISESSRKVKGTGWHWSIPMLVAGGQVTYWEYFVHPNLWESIAIMGLC